MEHACALAHVRGARELRLYFTSRTVPLRNAPPPVWIIGHRHGVPVTIARPPSHAHGQNIVTCPPCDPLELPRELLQRGAPDAPRWENLEMALVRTQLRMRSQPTVLTTDKNSSVRLGMGRIEWHLYAGEASARRLTSKFSSRPFRVCIVFPN